MLHDLCMTVCVCSEGNALFHISMVKLLDSGVTCPYSVCRKDRNIHGGGVMLLVHKDISHMPITELENDSESIWVKVFANKTSHFVASWYRPPGSTSEEFQLFREQLDYIKTHHKGKKLPPAHVLGDFNFKDIDWPDRLSKIRFNVKPVGGTID